jgi:rfaE bifunctional protein kinase chain/domain
MTEATPDFKIISTRFQYGREYNLKPRVLVCGDAMMDHYWSGRAKSISPEAPVPVYLIEKMDVREGAAANVANNIEAMGVPVERMFGGSRERINKIRVLAKNQHIARIDFDPPQLAIRVDADYEDALSRCTAVVFVDYGKGALANIRKLIAKANELERYILVDPKGHDFNKYRGANLIKPNREEMRDLVGGWNNQHELDLKAHKFLLDSDIESILLTQAEDGMTLYEHGNTHHRPASDGPVVDVSGAGEAALAGFSAAIAKGLDQPYAMDYAAKAAAVCVSRFGTTVVTATELGMGLR